MTIRRLCLVWALLSLSSSCASRPAAHADPPPPPDAITLTDAVWTGDLARIQALLTAHADPVAASAHELAPWVWTLVTRDRSARALLLAAAPDIHPHDPDTALALRMAVGQGDVELARELLRRRVPVDPPPRGRASPLLIAASNGNLAMLELLLDGGAQVNLSDGSGDTPLMAAVRAGSADCVARLLSRGADVKLRDQEGRTALAWARHEREDDLAAVLLAAGADSHDGVRASLPAPTASSAIARSLPVVQRDAATWTQRIGCSSCHHQPMALRVTSLADREGVPFDRTMATALRERLAAEEVQYQAESKRALASDVGVLRAGRLSSGDLAFATGLFLSARIDGGVIRGGPEETSAALLARLQLSDGHWRYGPLRGVIESSDLEATALATRVIAALAPGEDIAGRVERAKGWLIAADAATVIDHAYRLYGLHWTKAGAGLVAEETARLRALQRRDGGWGDVPGAPGDAFSTGLALVALHEAGTVSASDPGYRAGVSFLLERQEPDGTWLVHSRAVPLLPYVDGGSPHGKFQFISFAATCWSTMALIYAASPPT